MRITVTLALLSLLPFAAQAQHSADSSWVAKVHHVSDSLYGVGAIRAQIVHDSTLLFGATTHGMSDKDALREDPWDRHSATITVADLKKRLAANRKALAKSQAK